MQLFSDTISNYDKLINDYTGRDFVDLYFLTMLNVAYNVHNNGIILSNMDSQTNLFTFFSSDLL